MGFDPDTLVFCNWYYTGDPLFTTYELARDGRLFGFGEDKAWFPIYGDYRHDVWRGLRNIVHQAGVASVCLFGWPLLSLVPLLAALGSTREDKRVWWLYVPLLLMVLLHYSITFTASFLFPLSMTVAEGLRHWLVYAALYWLAALIVIAIAGPKRLVRGSRPARET